MEETENPLEMVKKKRDTVLELEVRGIRKSQELLDVRTILHRYDDTKPPMSTPKFPDLDERIKIFSQKYLSLSHCLQQFKENLPSFLMEMRDSMTLDPETANAFLMVTEDHQHVKNIGTKQDVSRNPKRFSYFSCVLGSQGFNSGRHCWETEVTHGGYWGLGVVKESVNRKQWFKLRPEEGIWAIGLYQNQYQALTSPCTSIVLKEKPKKIRLVLDYEEGLVSFYDTETMSHIFTFSATFTEKLFPFFWLPSKGSYITLCPSRESCFP
ncbi:tripartite motif-containing protein 10-like isoform X2 [Phascolarctos cinereus]